MSISVIKPSDMTLAEAIRAGCKITQPIIGHYIRYISDDECFACAIGAAVVGALIARYDLEVIANHPTLFLALALFPELEKNDMKLFDEIVGQHDWDVISRETIADRLEAGTLYHETVKP